tara:strand:+ start:444 stop:1607 length:1164 start_codon:yes stop_codon:yes gene_type:complete
MGYSYKDKCSFISLHLVAFLVHVVSASLAFYLAPPDEDVKTSIVYNQYNYSVNETTNIPYTTVSEVEFWHPNSIFLVGLNEAFAAGSHFIGLMTVLCFANYSNASDPIRTSINGSKRDRFDYKGYSRPDEYMRRWVEYAITAGLLEVGILIGYGEKSFLLLLFVFVGNIAMQFIGLFNDQQVRKQRLTGRKVGTLNYWPTAMAFTILLAIVIVFIFHSSNLLNKSLESLDFGYLTVVFALFYSSFGVHQLLYMYDPRKYAHSIDIDRVFIVLGFTAKIVLSWTYIAIARSTWAELGKPWDDKVPWESDKDDNLSSWNAVKIWLLVLSLVIILLEYFFEATGACPRMCGPGEDDTATSNNRGKQYRYYDNGPQEDDALLLKSRRKLNF